jgi:hypothetical protein
MEDRRPPRLVRILVLLGAIGCLSLAMCAHTPHATAPRNASTASGAPPDAASRATDPEYFPATKAPGPIYPQQQGD